MSELIRISYPIRKDLKNVSLIAMKICQNGIVAFGDSKASRKYDDNSLFEDKERGSIQKVFKHHNFIIATSGNNEVNIDGKNTTVEQIINELIKTSTSVVDFCNQFFEISKEDGREYQFMFGYKERGSYILQAFKINNLGIFP